VGAALLDCAVDGGRACAQVKPVGGAGLRAWLGLAWTHGLLRKEEEWACGGEEMGSWPSENERWAG
jgi:hypothetical protein